MRTGPRGYAFGVLPAGELTRSAAPPRRVLVLRFGAVGDVVLTTPAIEALARAWPDTEIVYAVRRPFVCLVEGNPYVSRVVALEPGEGVIAFSSRLREVAPDAILDLHGQVRSRAIRWLLPGVPVTAVASRTWTESLPVRLGLRPWRPTVRLADRFHHAVETLVGRPLPRGQLRQGFDEGAAGAVRALLAHAGVDPERPILALIPGANWETKRWPVERFADLAARAVEGGHTVLVTGSHEERPLAAAIRTRVPAAVDLCGVVTLPLLGALLDRCAAVVAHDSGPMHIARALGVPTLALFGSTSPDQFEFTGHSHLFAGVPCAPCHFYGRRSCPRGHFACMLDIDADTAWAALLPLLCAGRLPPVSA